jgi:hypothetical protein
MDDIDRSKIDRETQKSSLISLKKLDNFYIPISIFFHQKLCKNFLFFLKKTIIIK